MVGLMGGAMGRGHDDLVLYAEILQDLGGLFHHLQIRITAHGDGDLWHFSSPLTPVFGAINKYKFLRDRRFLSTLLLQCLCDNASLSNESFPPPHRPCQ